MKKTKQEMVFQWVVVFLNVLIILLIILPFMHIISVSISSDEAVKALSVGIFPKGFNLNAYKEILFQKTYIRSFINTVSLTIVTTFLSIIVNFMAAYAFSKEFYAKKFFTYMFVFTMYFSGGLIPSYILMTKWLGLTNNYLAFILPSLVSVFYIIIIRSQIEAIPPSLGEAAVIDGATEFQVLFKIILPAVAATIAAISMFTALSMWNMWYPVMIYSNKKELWTLQYYLRVLVFEKSMDYGSEGLAKIGEEEFNPQNFQMAAIVLVALPVVAIYPFVQKYFVKGILAGSVKE